MIAEDGNNNDMWRCAICLHPQVAEIDTALLRGESAAAVSKRFHLAERTMQRHKRHMMQRRAVEADSERREMTSSLYQEMEHLYNKSLDLMADVEGTTDYRLIMGVMKEVRQNIELLARMRGEIDGPQVQVQMNFHLQTVVLEALADYPEARIRVAEAIRGYLSA